jgi:hypothetical protein
MKRLVPLTIPNCTVLHPLPVKFCGRDKRNVKAIPLCNAVHKCWGPDLAAQVEGRQLRKRGDELLVKLDTRAFFQTWVTEWENELTLQASSRLHCYPVTIERDARINDLVPIVHLNEMTETLPKEIQQLKWLGFEKDILRSVLSASDESTKHYPFASAIKTALRSYQAVRDLVTPELEPLLMLHLLALRENISEAFDVKLDTSTAIAKKRRSKPGVCKGLFQLDKKSCS